jgi:hypothetical protein
MISLFLIAVNSDFVLLAHYKKLLNRQAREEREENKGRKLFLIFLRELGDLRGSPRFYTADYSITSINKLRTASCRLATSARDV